MPVRFPVVLSGPQTVRQTVGRHTTDPKEICRHGDRNIHRVAGVSTSGQVKGTRAGGDGNDIADKEELHRKIVGNREVGEGHARRQRHQRRVPRDQTSHQPGDREHLRRDLRHPRADIGQGDHRHTSV